MNLHTRLQSQRTLIMYKNDVLIYHIEHLKQSSKKGLVVTKSRILVTKQFQKSYDKFIKYKHSKSFQILRHLTLHFILFERILTDLDKYPMQIELVDEFIPSDYLLHNALIMDLTQSGRISSADIDKRLKVNQLTLNL